MEAIAVSFVATILRVWHFLGCRRGEDLGLGFKVPLLGNNLPSGGLRML